MSEKRDLTQYELAGRLARQGRQKSDAPIFLPLPERTAWIGGYYWQMGYERASAGTMNGCDSELRSYCAKCRMLGAEQYWADQVKRQTQAAEVLSTSDYELELAGATD